eukprot:CAMPEP_0197438132 /NCGR_PEP_ID=MMETSP1175-20131217/5213_1 /TAXON_ID=1003142 /ORGANISM="Triceratium dubium, Strain CCMP147" /LENGTH=319 /DNA_ID=CAMNT_0042967805 /DNA_START=44 /DNA_END=1003 /DNA_ORIENTATION=-
MTNTTKSNDDDPFAATIQLRTISTEDGREVSYSCTGNENDPPVLFFYPAGGNRRMLLFLAEKLPNLRLVCVNRPGSHGTTTAASSGGEGKLSHLDATVRDAVAVLDALGIDRVSVLCMCAGTPFAMEFCARHEDRLTGRFVGVCCWVQPADCGRANTKLSYLVGSQIPSAAGPLAGSVMSTMGMSLSSFPTTWVASALARQLSETEAETFYEEFRPEEFSERMKWVQSEAGGQGADVKVLLSAGVVDYQRFSEIVPSPIFWHSTEDAVVPYAGAEWLEQQLLNATLHAIPGATHNGCCFLLHPSIVNSINSLGDIRTES